MGAGFGCLDWLRAGALVSERFLDTELEEEWGVSVQAVAKLTEVERRL